MKGSDYCSISSLISKNEAIKLMKNADFTEKTGTFWIKKIWIFLKAHIKIEKVIKFGDNEIQKQKLHQHEKNRC